ncbi:MAG: fibronectin type III domain-containing protein, partial [Cyclobacteriaceae bacterium]
MKKYYIGLIIILLLIVRPCVHAQFETYPYDEDRYNWDDPFESLRLPNSIWFRLMKPNDYDSLINLNQNIKFPLIVFLHGSGERGTTNVGQLKHGGKAHLKAVEDDRFPGLLLYPQHNTNSGGWPTSEVDKVINVVNELIEHYDVDPNRIYFHGLSGGAIGTWDILKRYPKLVAAALPMSGNITSTNNLDYSNQIHIPIWLSQGSRDGVDNALPAQSINLVNFIRDLGGGIRYEYMIGVGHGTWGKMYAMPDFFEWMLDKSKLKIHVFDEQTEFCPGEPINVKLGVTGGFDDYQWAFNNTSTIIANGTNEINATEAGNYYVRFARGTEWTEWSEPVNLNNNRQPSPTPLLTSNGRSVNLPALDGSNQVTLSAIGTSTLFSWRKDESVISGQVDSFYTVTQPGGFDVAVKKPAEPTHFFDNTNSDNRTFEVPVRERAARVGCLSNYSDPINVTYENGNNVPAAPSDFSAYVLSESEVELQWQDNADNELNFEVYRSTASGGPYEMIGLLPPHNSGNAYVYQDINLLADTDYFYVIRAVNQNGGSDYSKEVSVKTVLDNTPPSAPVLSVGKKSSVSIDLSWTVSSDNVGIKEYEVFQDGVSLGTTSETNYTALNLVPGTQYSFTVKAIDLSG